MPATGCPSRSAHPAARHTPLQRHHWRRAAPAVPPPRDDARAALSPPARSRNASRVPPQRSARSTARARLAARPSHRRSWAYAAAAAWDDRCAHSACGSAGRRCAVAVFRRARRGPQRAAAASTRAASAAVPHFVGSHPGRPHRCRLSAGPPRRCRWQGRCQRICRGTPGRPALRCAGPRACLAPRQAGGKHRSRGAAGPAAPATVAPACPCRCRLNREGECRDAAPYGCDARSAVLAR